MPYISIGPLTRTIGTYPEPASSAALMISDTPVIAGEHERSVCFLRRLAIRRGKLTAAARIKR